MTQLTTRIERDSMGEMAVPAAALYGATTARAVENFPISGIPFGRSFIRALGLIKQSAARANADLGLLAPAKAALIEAAAQEVIDGRWDAEFPIDIFQTGSGTSTNMNANEVIATRGNQLSTDGTHLHPNDDVNMCQSSNDVIPAAIHVAALVEVDGLLLPALDHLGAVLRRRSEETNHIIKTGRTHLMDAMPIRLGDQIGGWAFQIEQSGERIRATRERLRELALGGTAVGSGINADPRYGAAVAAILARQTGCPFIETRDHFALQAAQDTAAELSGQLKATAVALMKIANDLRLMNSGPQAGLSEIVLPALQPGSSIMPGKINPVICEATMMVCAQVIGNDAAITTGAQLGNFELNVMLPVIAHNLLQSIEIMANAVTVLADRAVAGFTVNEAHLAELVDRNPIMVTALNAIIGYDLGAKIAKRAYAENRRVRDVAAEMTDLTPAELERLLDPADLADGGIKGASAGGG
ncbi:MAG TPA: class II fumarate hydratase [Thermomicrobiales bacterium]|nr:class II fumarate hydratase [Thermomicrobiales bacterium]HRA47493.1 class II fumarate hydratase [Thermomicrobiales bacterium]